MAVLPRLAGSDYSWKLCRQFAPSRGRPFSLSTRLTLQESMKYALMSGFVSWADTHWHDYRLQDH
jgi:hypothetical protein